MSTDNLEQLEEFVSESIRNIPKVLVTSTMNISREYKNKDSHPKNKYPFFKLNFYNERSSARSFELRL
jgi:DNA-binding Lrp family transcriptional regulator